MVGGAQARARGKLWTALDGGCRLDAAEGRRWRRSTSCSTASPPLPHGTEGTTLGYVVALTVTDRREGPRFVFASDVQGPLSPVAAAYLIRSARRRSTCPARPRTSSGSSARR